jgi:hypothetical protein
MTSVFPVLYTTLMVFTVVRCGALAGGYLSLAEHDRPTARRACGRVGCLLILLIIIGIMLGYSKQELHALGSWQQTPRWTDII